MDPLRNCPVSTPRHIVLLSPGFPAHDTDYACIPPLQAYLPALRDRFPAWKISVIALQYPYRRGAYPWQGQEVHAVGGRNRRWAKPLTWQRARRILNQLHRRQSVNLVHSLWLREASWLAQRWTQRQGIPTVATLMGQDAGADNRYLRQIDLDTLTVTAISTRAAERYAEATGKSVAQVIPWGIAPQTDPLPKLIERSVDVLGVGSLVPVKNWPRFVRVIAHLADLRPDLRAILVGEGPERNRLEHLIREAGLERNLELRGQLPRPQVLTLMENSRVLLHTAHSEGQGYVFVEALAGGMQVVSTPVGIAADSAKWSVAPDTISLVAAVQQALEYPADHWPRHPFPLAQTVEDYAEIYASLI